MQTQNSPHTLMHKSNPIYLRASVASSCNLTCVYCPKKSGMENQVPASLKGRKLNVDEYCKNFAHLARNGVEHVSFTGGEPILNPDLPEIILRSRELFSRVELTTNGYNLLNILDKIAPYLDLIKISLDAIDKEKVYKITKGLPNDLDRAALAIRESCKAGLNVAINTVVMKSNITEISKLIDFCRELNKERNGKIYISLLDCYYSNERRDFWEQEFVPITILEEQFTRMYGDPVIQKRFGCRFFWFNAGDVNVRFKDSISATYRAQKCNGCKNYCQEGICGLKHSVEGWVTTCPNDEENFGVRLSPDVTPEEADRLLEYLIQDIQSAKPDSNSFYNLLQTHQLKPNNLNYQL